MYFINFDTTRKFKKIILYFPKWGYPSNPYDQDLHIVQHRIKREDRICTYEVCISLIEKKSYTNKICVEKLEAE
jgi:hypothetical protein